MTSNEQTQGFGRVVFAIFALMACEVALLSQKVIKIDSTQSSWSLWKVREVTRSDGCY